MEYLLVFKSREKVLHSGGELAYLYYTEKIMDTEDNHAILIAEDKSDQYDYSLEHVHNITTKNEVYCRV